MSPSKREREYARQRYERWQERLTEKQQQRRRRRQLLLTVAVVVAVVAVVGAVWFLTREPAEDVAEAAPESSEPAEQAADNPCPVPSSTPADVQLDAVPEPAVAEGRTWAVQLETSCGPVAVELYGDRAPQATASFIGLAREGFFAGTPCHRLTTEGIFVLQCGDPTGSGTGGPGYEFGPVENAPEGDVYPAGTLAMARQGGNGDSMGSQFFLVYGDSTIPSDAAGGYTVFGRVTEGLEVVQQIADGGVEGGGGDGQPARPLTIEQVTVP